jgi:hypothetical protein
VSSPLFRDVPPRAAIVVVALALVASVVTATPWTDSSHTLAEPVEDVTATQPQATPHALELESLERRKASGTVPDLFAPAPQPAAPASPPVQAAALASSAPAPATQPPALPFRYLGRLLLGERSVVFLERGQNLYSVAAGETIDTAYRIESISDTAVTFRHLSLDVTQTLVVPRTQ